MTTPNHLFPMITAESSIAAAVSAPTAKPPVPVAVLVRVSTTKQETARQVAELRTAAAAKGWDVVKVYEEAGVSGTLKTGQRDTLAEIEADARAGTFQKVMVHEVSRLGRRNSTVHQFVEMLEELKISLYWHAQAVETLLPSGKRNPAAGLMLSLLAEMARNETETMRERIMSGLAEARRQGKRLGRPEGSGYSQEHFLGQHKDVVKLLKDGQSIRHTAKITGKGISTVQRVKAALNSRG